MIPSLMYLHTANVSASTGYLSTETIVGLLAIHASEQRNKTSRMPSTQISSNTSSSACLTVPLGMQCKLECLCHNGSLSNSEVKLATSDCWAELDTARPVTCMANRASGSLVDSSRDQRVVSVKALSYSSTFCHKAASRKSARR